MNISSVFVSLQTKQNMNEEKVLEALEGGLEHQLADCNGGQSLALGEVAGT
jgi:hypothetical protein